MNSQYSPLLANCDEIYSAANLLGQKAASRRPDHQIYKAKKHKQSLIPGNMQTRSGLLMQ